MAYEEESSSLSGSDQIWQIRPSSEVEISSDRAEGLRLRLAAATSAALLQDVTTDSLAESLQPSQRNAVKMHT